MTDYVSTKHRIEQFDLKNGFDEAVQSIDGTTYLFPNGAQRDVRWGVLKEPPEANHFRWMNHDAARRHAEVECLKRQQVYHATNSETRHVVKENNRLKYVPGPEQTHDSFLEEMEAQVETYAKDAFKDAMFLDFLRHVANLRHTKEGRFVRVRFKTGAVVELVPEGSLASGMKMVEDEEQQTGWRFVSPDLERHWQDFCTKYLKNHTKLQTG